MPVGSIAPSHLQSFTLVMCLSMASRLAELDRGIHLSYRRSQARPPQLPRRLPERRTGNQFESAPCDRRRELSLIRMGSDKWVCRTKKHEQIINPSVFWGKRCKLIHQNPFNGPPEWLGHRKRPRRGSRVCNHKKSEVANPNPGKVRSKVLRTIRELCRVGLLCLTAIHVKLGH